MCVSCFHGTVCAVASTLQHAPTPYSSSSSCTARRSTVAGLRNRRSGLRAASEPLLSSSLALTPSGTMRPADFHSS